MVDNCKTAVIKLQRGDEKAELNPAYEELACHYGFQIDPCNVRRPNEKGRVENTVGYIRTSFLAGHEPTPLNILAPALADCWTIPPINGCTRPPANRPCNCSKSPARLPCDRCRPDHYDCH